MYLKKEKKKMDNTSGINKEDIFDTKNDGKPMKKKKVTKKEKDTRAFIMMDGKKFHEVGGKIGF